MTGAAGTDTGPGRPGGHDCFLGATGEIEQSRRSPWAAAPHSTYTEAPVLELG